VGDISPDMPLEDFIKIGEQIKMREELLKNPSTQEFNQIDFVNDKTISEADIEFIQKEFKKDVLNRDWSKLYEILNHLKTLSNSLIVNEIRIP
jgi:hypothetical protein